MRLIVLTSALCLSLLCKSQCTDLIHYMDSVMRSEMVDHGIPGASYSFVKNGKIIQSNHFGYRDLESKEQVNGNTLFMFGSLAKLITTTALLKLYDKGKVSFDADIRTYLPDFPISESITLRHLLTHTAGFEESVFERVKLDGSKLSPLKTYMYDRVPQLIFEPGSTAAYSNYGMSLAGMIVQEVSGIPFQKYVDQYIFKPLQMENSSFVLNDSIRKNLASSYNQKGVKNPIEYVQTIPSSMLISTANDMGKFMLFQIIGDERVVKNETLKLMQTPQYRSHPNMWGRCLGFFEKQFRGVFLLEHGGSRNGFYSNMVMSATDSIGLIVVANGGDSNFRNRISSAFLKSQYKKNVFKKDFLVDNKDLKEFEGTYYSNRRIESGFGRLFLQAGFVDRIKVNSGTNNLNLLGYEYGLQSNDQFNISNDSLVSFPVSFGRDKEGNVNQLFLPGRSDSYSKLPWYENERFAIIVIVVSLITFLALLIRNYSYLPGAKKANFSTDSDSSFKTFATSYCFLNILFILSLAGVVSLQGESFQYQLPSYLYVIFSLGLLGLPLLGLMIWTVFRKGVKSMNAVLIIVKVIYILVLFQWNLIGFNF